MSDFLLAKPQLPPDWIDCSVGEPHIVRDILLNIFDVSNYEMPQPEHCWEYPVPTGFQPLVKLLEDKHKAPVIITNGAKQALGASFHALRRMGKKKLGMRTPYWALIPPLVKMHGLEPLTSYVGADCNLLLLPNNPDGFSSRADVVQGFSNNCKEKGVPLIHDAAYYTHTYLPSDHPLDSVGDIQIYSISKMLGLSGLRIGYVVCKNVEFYKYIQEYMEAMTVGVSVVSQIFLYDLMNKMNSYPELTNQFEDLSFQALQNSKGVVKKIRPDVLEVPLDIDSTPGMFGWFKVGAAANFTESKINLIDGALFGVPEMVRMNLGFNTEKMEEIVRRLNSVR